VTGILNEAVASAGADSLPDVAMTDALTATWKAIRRRHPKVPDATITVAPGRGSACGAVAWDTGMPVILVGAQTIQDGPLAILEVLLHQAAHGLLAATGQRPAGDDGKHYPDEHSQGNAGRYHNKSYRDAAQSLGLKAVWTQGGTGWSATTAVDELLTVYEGAVRQLVTAMTEWQPPAPLPRSARKSGGNGIAARCQCQPPRTIRMRGIDAATDLREHPVVCSVCGKPFTP
jgi:hypothetical protein